MRILNTLLLISLTAAIAPAQAQQKGWKSADIADSLKKEAYSVVRQCQTSVSATTPKAMTVKHRRVVTVLNKKGEDHALWHTQSTRFDRLTSFSGKIYNDRGEVVKKVKQSDVHISRFSDHLASDVQNNYYQPPVMDYPYTVEYEWEEKSSDGYVEYGFFSPIDHTRQSLEASAFRVTVPTGTAIRYTAMPQRQEARKAVEGKADVYEWTISPHRAIIADEYDDDALYIYPSVLAVPLRFQFGESTGTLDSWETKGAWYASLYEGRGQLLPADVAKVRELTATCSDDLSKIQALYNYLAEKTRYVSIQLGIGGWQPMTAAEVGTTGFGDCKALTNYMQALLREAGIESYQTIISTEYADLMADFPNMHQTNHVILTVPNREGGADLYIECTNPQLPLGFIPGNYAGHEALQIADGKGRLIRLPAYTPDTNRERLQADVTLAPEGTSTIRFSCDHYGDRYDGVSDMAHDDEKHNRDRVAHWISLKDPVVTQVKISEERGATPHLDVTSHITGTYAESHGNRLFLPLNPFRKFSAPRFRAGRTRPIVVRQAYKVDDEIRILLPEGYAYSAGQSHDSVATDFGSYALSIEQQSRHLIIRTTVSILAGRFPASRKADFLAFREAIARMYDKRLILEKANN